MTYATLRTRIVSLKDQPIEAVRDVIREFESDTTTTLEDRLRLMALRDGPAPSGMQRLEQLRRSRA